MANASSRCATVNALLTLLPCEALAASSVPFTSTAEKCHAMSERWDMDDKPSQNVFVTDVNMPFFSMVRFMVKWAIASIPALLILLILVPSSGD